VTFEGVKMCGSGIWISYGDTEMVLMYAANWGLLALMRYKNSYKFT